MFRSTSSFDRLLERATSNLLLEPDWNAILQICDSIRSGDTNPKYAISAIKKKFYHDNPHVVLYGLTVSLTFHLNWQNLFFSFTFMWTLDISCEKLPILWHHFEIESFCLSATMKYDPNFITDPFPLAKTVWKCIYC